MLTFEESKMLLSGREAIYIANITEAHLRSWALHELLFPEKWEYHPFSYESESFLDKQYQIGLLLSALSDMGADKVYIDKVSIHFKKLKNLEIYAKECTPAKTQENKSFGGRKKQRKRRQPVTQLLMAELCGVALATVKKWDSGNAPEEYSGRNDLGLAKIFANQYKNLNAGKREARAMSRASTGHDLENYAQKDDGE